MSTAAPIAPPKAAGVTSHAAPGTRSMIKMPASPAPEEMPMICGSASGLRRIACKIAPERERLMPTSAATIVRGRRMFHKICSCTVPCTPPRALKISAVGISTEPFAAESSMESTASPANSASSKTRRFMDKSAAPYSAPPQDSRCRD